MELSFTIQIQNPELIKKEEYPLFWWGNRYLSLLKIGICKVELANNQLNCTATIDIGGARQSTNDRYISDFKLSDIYSNKYEYSILFKDDIDGKEYVYGICIS